MRLLTVAVTALAGLGLAGAPAFADTTSSTALPHPVGGFVLPSTRVSATSNLGGFGAEAVVPESADLRPYAPAVGDQGQISSCVAWSIGYSIMGYYANRQGGVGAPYAPLYLYMRAVGSGAPNNGLNPETALGVAQSTGVDSQADYFQGTSNWQTAPTAAEVANAANYKINGWTRLWVGANQGTAAQTLVKQAVANGAPVSIAIPVFRDFENLRSDALYNTTSGQNLGGHMITIYGYDAQGVWIRNSWGTWWGSKGDAHLSWGFINTAALAAYTVGGVATKAPAPTVTTLSAKSAPANGGGVAVTISGTNLASATAVQFGTTKAAFTAASSGPTTTLVATVPAHDKGTVDVTVTGPGGTSAAGTATKFTYVTPPPAVTGLTGATVSTLGGNTVTVTGTELTGATAVRVGTIPATGVKVLSPTSLTFVAPAHAAGAAHVSVVTPAGTSATVDADQVTYVAPPVPAVRSLSPSSGLTTAATTVVVTGANLGNAAKVTAGTTVLAYTKVSDTQLKVTLPAHAAGGVPIQVTAPGGTSTAVTFTYVAPSSAKK
jgi:hypothetical protein